MIPVTAVAAAVLIAAVAAGVVGYRQGKLSGASDGYERGYQAATATLNASHSKAIAELNQQAERDLRVAVESQQKRHLRIYEELSNARAEGANELARIAADRDAHVRRVQQLLSETAARSGNANRGCTMSAAPGAAAGSEAAETSRVFLERVGKNLAGLTSDADETLAQFDICYRYATTLKKRLEEHGDH